MYVNIIDCKGNILLKSGEKYTLSSSTYTTLEFSVGEPIISIPRNSSLTPPSFVYKWDGNELTINDPINDVIKCDVHDLAGEVKLVTINSGNITAFGDIEVKSKRWVDAKLQIYVDPATPPQYTYTVSIGGAQYNLVKPLKITENNDERYALIEPYIQVVK